MHTADSQANQAPVCWLLVHVRSSAWPPYKMVLQVCSAPRADGHVKVMTISVSCRRHGYRGTIKAPIASAILVRSDEAAAQRLHNSHAR